MLQSSPNLKAFRLLEENSAQLKEIAKNFPPESPSHIALKTAGTALLYAVTKHADDFLNFLATMDSELTTEERHSCDPRGSTQKAYLLQLQ